LNILIFVQGVSAQMVNNVRFFASKVLKLPLIPSFNVFKLGKQKQKNKINSFFFDSRNVSDKLTLESAATNQDHLGNVLRHSELKLICTELDRHGYSSLRQGLFSKSSLCSSLGLQARDLRKLDGTLKNQLPSILIRPSAILVNFDSVRAVIKWDRVTFFDGQEVSSQVQTILIKDLATKLKTKSSAPLPFEFIAIESILQTTLQALQDEFDNMAPAIEQHLTILERFVHWDKLKTMLECKKRVALFHERISSLRNCIAEVLESDADMAAMYLTAKSGKSQPRPVYAHEEIELLLESYLKIAEEIVSRVQLLASNIQSTEDIVNIGLVGQRNELLLLELKLGIGTFSASMGGFGASILGMNLINGMEGNPQAFFMILTALISVSLFAFTSSWRRMLQLIRKY
jgi:magnesium transporter